MSNSITITNKALTLPADRKVTLLDVRMDSQNWPRLKTYPEAEAISVMTAIVMRAHDLKGIPADEENVAHIATNLYDEMMADEQGLGTSNLCFLEINHIIKKAVLTTEMYGLSVANLYKAITDWIKTEGVKLQEEARKKRAEQRRKQMDGSPVSTMISVMAGKMARTNK